MLAAEKKNKTKKTQSINQSIDWSLYNEIPELLLFCCRDIHKEVAQIFQKINLPLSLSLKGYWIWGKKHGKLLVDGWDVVWRQHSALPGALDRANHPAGVDRLNIHNHISVPKRHCGKKMDLLIFQEFNFTRKKLKLKIFLKKIHKKSSKFKITPQKMILKRI